MKKILFSLLLAVITVGVTSCDSFEDAAKKQMENTLKEMSKNPETLEISNIETMFANDSTCVLHAKTKGQNGFGGWSTSDIEYVYIKVKSENEKDRIREGFGRLDDDDYESVYKTAKGFYMVVLEKYKEGSTNDLPYGMNGKGWDNEPKEVRAFMLHFACELVSLSNGRYVENNNDNTEKDDWK